MLLYMLSSWRMYEMHPALFLKTGCYTAIEDATWESVQDAMEMVVARFQRDPADDL
jgi:hypothetical protein